jgi:hypothetical protein
MNRSVLFFALYLATTISPFLRAGQSLEHVQRMQTFAAPVVFSAAGIKDFFWERFNSHAYTAEFLPHCFLHVEDFLHHSFKSKYQRSMALVTLDLFHQRLKECRHTNPFALSLLIKQLPVFLGSFCRDETDIYKKRTSELIYKALDEHFEELKANPQLFIDNLAHEIVETIVNPGEPTAQEISNMTVRFIESALDKAMWDPRDQEYTWELVKLIAEQLGTLHTANVIMYEKDLNHMMWSLISRYAYFIELSGPELSLTCYQHIRDDIENCAIKAPFLLLEELDEHSITKRDRLMEIVLAGEVSLRVNGEHKDYQEQQIVYEEKVTLAS